MITIKSALAPALLFALSIGTAMAQDLSTVTIKPSKKGETSSTIIKEVESDFNSVKPVEKSLDFIRRMPTRWQITQEELNNYGVNDQTQFIEVYANYHNDTQKSTYNSKGKLVQYKEVIINQPLPEKVLELIKTEYPNYKILGNIEVINTEIKKSDFIKVKLAEGLRRKVLHFSPEGDLVVK